MTLLIISVNSILSYSSLAYITEFENDEVENTANTGILPRAVKYYIGAGSIFPFLVGAVIYVSTILMFTVNYSMVYGLLLPLAGHLSYNLIKTHVVTRASENYFCRGFLSLLVAHALFFPLALLIKPFRELMFSALM